MKCLLTGRCHPLRYKCDLEFDCGVTKLGILDTSDEDPSICNITRVCPPGKHMCLSGGQCLALSKFCDGVRDCVDGSDEHPHCGSELNASNIGFMRKHGRAVTPDEGVKCYCPEGQIPEGIECVDEDECRRPEYGGIPLCAHFSTNLISRKAGEPGFPCSCAKNYILMNDIWCRNMDVERYRW
ncbi:hypothetical protein AB6A40_008821 [Gnathostoma spinigerum]|uniref:Uncharacterized protein n=1 Tax=Gnathostoma spinigerum TaxID=75299 RepID=A0ABD6EZD1_9BILA